LVIDNPKEYTYNVSGYTFSDFDKWIIVLHKKEWKIISLKNLGDNMNVVYLKDEKVEKLKDGKMGINKAIKMFQWFDEETGKKYYFIPWLGEAQQQEKNAILKKLWTGYTIEKTPKGMIVYGTEDEALETPLLGYFFGLMLIYGKWEAKNTLDHQKNKWNEDFLDERGIPATWETGSMNEVKWWQISKAAVCKELNAIKIQIPLSGQHLAYEEDLDTRINMLQHNGIFVKADKLTNKNGIIYQISSNDYELLEIFAQWYETIEKFEKITKAVFTQEMKIKLIEFIKTNPEIPQDGKAEVLKQLEEWTIKLLTK